MSISQGAPCLAGDVELVTRRRLRAERDHFKPRKIVEKRMEQLKNEIERLDELNSKIDTIFSSCSTLPRRTLDSSES
jgi:hypothetical protein